MAAKLTTWHLYSLLADSDPDAALIDHQRRLKLREPSGLLVSLTLCTSRIYLDRHSYKETQDLPVSPTTPHPANTYSAHADASSPPAVPQTSMKTTPVFSRRPSAAYHRLGSAPNASQGPEVPSTLQSNPQRVSHRLQASPYRPHRRTPSRSLHCEPRRRPPWHPIIKCYSQ